MDPIALGFSLLIGVFALVTLLSVRPAKVALKEGEALLRFRAAFAAAPRYADPNLPPNGEFKVLFKTSYVLNFIDTWEKLDLTPKACIYEISGRLCDGSFYSLESEFTISVPADSASVLQVARTYGVERASSSREMQEVLRFGLVEAVQARLAGSTSEQLLREETRLGAEICDSLESELTLLGLQILDVNLRKVRLHKKESKSWTT